MDNRGFICGFCNQRFLQLHDIQDHLQNFHHAARNEGQRCGINNCPLTYRNPNSLRAHRSRVHRREVVIDEEIPNIQEQENNDRNENINHADEPNK